MKKDVEKFEEILSNHKILCCNLGASTSIESINRLKEEIQEEKEKLIKMYSKLEGSHEKPVIKVDCWYIDSLHEGFSKIGWEGKSSYQEYITKNLELKENTLITDDFIFILRG